MTRDPILIRVDGTSRTGHERLARCLILAAALQRRRRTAYFLSQLDPGWMGLNIKRAGNEWLEADNPAGSGDDLAELMQEVRRLEPAAVIIDEENVSEDYLSEIAGTGTMVVVMDHHANIRFPAQLIINPLLGPSKDDYEFYPGAQLLLGQRYALVRPEIRRQRPIRSQEPPPMCLPGNKNSAGQFRALLALGEDDRHRCDQSEPGGHREHTRLT